MIEYNYEPVVLSEEQIAFNFKEWTGFTNTGRLTINYENHLVTFEHETSIGVVDENGCWNMTKVVETYYEDDFKEFFNNMFMKYHIIIDSLEFDSKNHSIKFYLKRYNPDLSEETGQILNRK